MNSVARQVKGAVRAAIGAGPYARLSTALADRWRRSAQACWWMGRAGRANLRRLGELRGSCRGRRCFILGGGPSLATADLARLRGEVTIGSNAIFLLTERTGFTPMFYTVEDQLVAEDRALRINGLRGMTKIFPRALSCCLCDDESTVWVNFLYKYEGFPKFSPDLLHVAYWGGTVTFFNLQLAHFLGCREIYLMGVDHSYQVPVGLNGDMIVSQSPDVNHFHPDYFGPGFRWHDPKLERMEAAYVCAREFAARVGMQVLNATDGGKLEVFPRVDFNSLFG